MPKKIDRIDLAIAISVLLSLFMLYLIIFCPKVEAQLQPAIDSGLAVRAIIGEASNQGYKGMLDLASGIRNRGHLGGVYGVKAKHVDKEPEWVWKLARKAWKESEHNRTHTGTHWENIKAFGTPYWVKSMNKVYEYKDHVWYKEKSWTEATY